MSCKKTGNRLGVLVMVSVTFLSLLSLVGCGSRQDVESSKENRDMISTEDSGGGSDITSENASEGTPGMASESIDDMNSGELSEKPAKQIDIYYWAMMSNHAEKEAVTIEDFGEEDLQTVSKVLGCLASHNIVSIDTKAEAFSMEKESGKTLHLDLNKAFSEYLNTMGSSGEQIILSSLTNTFLDAWNADCIYITAAGKTLQTDKKIYEDAFGKSELNLTMEEQEEENQKKEKIPYLIEACQLENQDGIEIPTLQVKYPVFSEMEEREVQEAINEKIQEYVKRCFVAEGLRSAIGDYTLYERAKDIYIVFEGTTCGQRGDYETLKKLVLHFDLETGSLMQLYEGMDICQIENQIRNGEYEILSEGIDKDTFSKMLDRYYPDLQNTLEQFDIGKGFNSISVPPGYSYETEDGLILIFSVLHGDGDYVEIKTKAPVL